MTNRWWIYQQTRFPILIYGPLVATLSFSCLGFSSLTRGNAAVPGTSTALVAFASSFLFFLQLRIADEFKDYEEDLRYRSYRPVPRGLVTLGELRFIGIAGALVQVGLSVWLDRSMVWLLAAVWLYLGLMSKEFFVREWLRARPFTYLWTHMLILPLIVLYITACDWLVAGATPSVDLFWLLLAGFFNGIVIEIGRKIRTPEDEEPGVETYSILWGRRNAALAWVGASLLAAAAMLLAADRIDAALPVGGLLSVLLMAEAIIAWRFLRQPVRRRGKLFELMSGLWTLLAYSSLGAVRLILHG